MPAWVRYEYTWLNLRFSPGWATPEPIKMALVPITNTAGTYLTVPKCHCYVASSRDGDIGRLSLKILLRN